MYSIKELASLLDGKILGDKLEVSGLAPFFLAKEDEVTFAAEEKYFKKIGEIKAKVVIVPTAEGLPEDKTYIIVKSNPRELMPKLLNFFKREVRKPEKAIEDSANIADSSLVGVNSYIGHDVIIKENVEIYPNVYIGQGVKIGKGTIIYPNVTIREFCEIGENCIIQAGTTIGTDGFGFVKVNGINKKIDQIGRVIIGNEVEIGSNTTIDRGAIGDTIIKDYTKIDNLVQIAHNDIIGKNCLIVSQVGISGSVEVGDNCVLGGKTGTVGHIKIGENSQSGGNTMIRGNLKPNSVVAGDPMMPIKDFLKSMVLMRKFPKLVDRIKKLEKELKELKK